MLASDFVPGLNFGPTGYLSLTPGLDVPQVDCFGPLPVRHFPEAFVLFCLIKCCCRDSLVIFFRFVFPYRSNVTAVLSLTKKKKLQPQ